MFFADEEQAIRSRFYSNWPTLQPSVAMAFPGVKFNPTNGIPYVKLDILSGAGKQIDIGTDNPIHRFVGVIQVTIYVPPQEGMQRARTLADSAASIWRSQQFSYGNSGRILCFTPQLIGPKFDAQWSVLVVSCPFWRDTNRGLGADAGGAVAQANPVTIHGLRGAIDGVNSAFTLDSLPDPATFKLFRNGLIQQTPADYTLSGTAVTFAAPLQAGDTPVAFYASLVPDRQSQRNVAGAVDGVNAAFVIAGASVSATSLMLFRNGMLLHTPGDFTLAGNVATLGAAPAVGDTVLAYASASGAPARQVLTGTQDGANKVFQLPFAADPTLVMIFRNGTFQVQNGDYVLVGAQVTFAVAPAVNDQLEGWF